MANGQETAENHGPRFAGEAFIINAPMIVFLSVYGFKVWNNQVICGSPSSQISWTFNRNSCHVLWNMVVGYVIVLFWCEKLLSLEFFQQRVPTLNFFYYIQILVAMTYKKAEVETLKSSIGGLRWFKCNPAHVINWSGWWFQTFSMFHFMYGMSSFPLTSSYFSRWLNPPTRYIIH